MKFTNWLKKTLAFAFRAPLMLLMGVVPGAPGSIDYSYDTGSGKRIAVAFSKRTIVKYYSKTVVAQITNTNTDDEIKTQGDTVVFNSTPDVTVFDVERNMAPPWETLDSPAVVMKVNQAIGFAFRMDKIDLSQFADKAFMDKCADDAAQKQKISIDTKFLGRIYADADPANQGLTAGAKYGQYNLGVTGTPFPLTKTNILDKLTELDGVLDEQDVPEEGRWAVLPSHFSTMLRQSDIKDASMTGDGMSTLRSGKIGKLGNLDLYSSNLYTPVTDGGKKCVNMVFGHQDATCFASQLVDVEYFEKLETVMSGKGMKGLQVFDWKTVKGQALGNFYAYKAQL